MDSNLKISFIGSGNVATHLAKGLFDKHFSIKQICSKSLENAKTLAEEVDAEACTSLSCLEKEVDCIIIAVSDDIIESIANEIPSTNALVVHTSGTKDIELLNSFENYGIFYPLQTFSKGTSVNLNEVPLCLESNSDKNNATLEQLAKAITTSYQYINSEQRKVIHLAAVFACNFSNHMYSISKDILDNNELDFKLLEPLIQATAAKISRMNPIDAQTGPAVRKDHETIKNHLSLLEDSIDYRDIYELITKHIIQSHGKL